MGLQNKGKCNNVRPASISGTTMSHLLSIFLSYLHGWLMRCQRLSSNCEGGLWRRHSHPFLSALCCFPQQINQILMTATKHLKGGFVLSQQGHAVGERERVLIITDRCWFSWRRSCQTLGFSRFEAGTKCGKGVNILQLNTRISFSVMEDKTSVKWQRTQVQMTKLVAVTPNPDTALW